MKPALQLRLGQQLSMTPQLQQAIRLLQMSAVELKAEIQTALESNLMLEQLEDDAPEEAGDERATRDGDDFVGTDWDPAEPTWSSTPAGGLADALEWQAAEPEGLREHLLWQLELTPFTPLDAAIAATIIDCIDEDGYLKASIADIASALLGETEAGDDEIEAVLHRIQQFDPVGVGARDLRECLQVQLGQLPPGTSGLTLAGRIVDGNLDDLAAGRLDTLRTCLSADAAALDDAIALVRNLNPRPGSSVAADDTQFVVPDVLVVRRDDRWAVELNPDLAPRLRINPYYAELARKPASADDGACMRSHLQEARWFLKSLQNRAQTLLRVATFIVEHQLAWLDQGDTAMKPLVLRDVAEALEMHESTISRVTANKYLHTPRGVFEFRHFFSGQLGTTDGGTSATAVRAQIRRLLADEDPLKPLSDGRIAELLADRGMRVARRTVAKYREGMSIPPAATRRRAT